MNVYDYISTFATAVRDTAAIKDYCIAQFGKGLLVQVDDDNEDPIESDKAPYCLIHSTTGSANDPVSDASDINLRIEVGTMPTGEPPYYTDTTARSVTANGLRKYGAGEKAVDLLDLILTAIKAVNIDACTIMNTSSIEADGILLFPLQIASSVISISEQKDLASFN